MKKIMILILILAISFSHTTLVPTYAAEWPTGPTPTTSKAVIVMDASSGTVLYGVNETEKNYPASITKILTTLVALENGSLTDTITFSHDAIYNIDKGSTHIGMNEGEQISMKDALYAVMLASANEVSNGVAETISGSNAEFCKLMNERAKKIGCTGSNFVNPHGLHNADHYTTCYDMALICREALKNKTFREITSTDSYQIAATNLTDEVRGFANHQQMLTGSKYPKYKYEGCIGGKTGYTNSASNTLVSFAERNGRTLISVVMNSDFNGQYTDSIALLDFGFDNFKNLDIVDNESANQFKSDLSLFKKYCKIGTNDAAYIYIQPGSAITVPTSAEYKDSKKEVKFFDDIQLNDGLNIIGNITYTLDTKVVGKHNIILNKYKSNSLPTIDLPEEIKNYSVIVNGNTPKSSIARFKPSSFDALLITICFGILLFIYFFIKTLSRKKRRRRAFHSRRRHSQNYWDDFNF